MPQSSRPSVALIGTRGYPSYYGGFETAVRYIAPYLSSNGWDVSVYGRPTWVREDDPGRDPSVESILTPGIESTSLSTLSYGLTACVHAAARKPDVALVMNVANGYFLPLLRARGIPTVVNVDGIEWERDKWGPSARKVFRQGAVLTAKHATSLIADAEAIGDYWRTHFDAETTYIPYGGTPAGAEVPPPAGLESGSYILLVARLVPENSIMEFIAALDHVPADIPVVIVGSAAPDSDIDVAVRELVERQPRVAALGHVSDDDLLHALWAHAGAYFHGHSVGGTNPALVQAMALGTRIVARDTAFNDEVLSGTGVLTAPEPRAIADALVEMVRTGHTWGELARTRAEERFAWDAVCAAYEDALWDAIAHRGGRSRRVQDPTGSRGGQL